MLNEDHPDIVVIGAGITGITCARALQQAGLRVVLLDKGRGIGGRMATRRVTLDSGEASFDHGAQYLPAGNAAFEKLLTDAGAAPWPIETAVDAPFVGVPGMSALPRVLAAGLDIRQSVEVTGLSQDATGWHVETQAGPFVTKRVILTIPAPQVARLLGTDHPLSTMIRPVRMAPSLTLMAAFPPESARPFVSHLDPAHPLAWIAQNSSKPARGGHTVTWVAQAGAEWSGENLEKTPDEIAAQMLPMLCTLIDADPQSALYVSAHRWRYALTAQPLGRPFLQASDHSLYLGGDWCLGARAEHGWASGCAIAADILGHADVG